MKRSFNYDFLLRDVHGEYRERSVESRTLWIAGIAVPYIANTAALKSETHYAIEVPLYFFGHELLANEWRCAENKDQSNTKTHLVRKKIGCTGYELYDEVNEHGERIGCTSASYIIPP